MSGSPSPTPRPFFSPLFVAAALILVTATIGLPPTLAAVTRYYSKEPIDLRKSLRDLDVSRLAPFLLVPEDRRLIDIGPGDVGTEEMIAPSFQAVGASADEQVMLFVTYYSDPRSQIPHTPEVCYRQGGAVIDSITTITVDTPRLAPDRPRIDARRLEIDQYGHRSVLVYVFLSGGKIYHDREAVRFALGWPGDKYTYFSKVEA